MGYCDVQIVLPPILESGIYQVKLSWNFFYNQSGVRWTPASFNVTVTDIQPEVRELIPSTVSPQGGDTIMVYVTGLPTPLDVTSILILFNDVPSETELTELVSDYQGLQIRVNVPSLKACLSIFTIKYFASVASIFQASAPVLVLNSDSHAQCVKGCELLFIKNELQDAQISVQAKITDLSSSFPDLEVTCSFLLSQNYTIFQRCKSVLTEISTGDTCGQHDDMICLNITLKYGLEEDILTNSSDSELQGYFEIRESGNTGLCLLAQFSIFKGPRVQNAYFQAAFGKFDIWFDQDIEVKQSNRSCTPWFKSLAKFGEQPICLWNTLSNLIVVLGFNATLAPLDIVTLSSQIRTLRTKTAISLTSFQIEPPHQPMLPKVSIAGPNLVSECDTAALQAVTSSTRVNFFWGCYNDISLDEYLSNLSPTDNVAIQGSMLVSSRTYFVVVKAVFDFGYYYSDIATHSISVRQYGIPLVGIDLAPLPYFQSKNLSFAASAAYSECATASGSAFVFVWLLTQKQSFFNLLNTEISMSDGPLFHVMPENLSEGVTYSLTLYVLSNNGSSYAECSFDVIKQPMIATIAGGNRYVFIGDKITVDSSETLNLNPCSYEQGALGPNINLNSCFRPQILQFSWECCTADRLPCRLRNGSLAVFETSPEVDINLSLLNLGETIIDIAVTVFSYHQFASSFVNVQTSLNATFGLQINVIHENPQEIALQGLATIAVAPQYQWVIISPSGAFADLSDTSVFLSGEDQNNFIVGLNAGSSSIFHNGMTYTFQLKAIESNLIGLSWLGLRIPSPPSGGSCTVNPSKGIALVTEFKISCMKWTGENLPLQYQFSGSPYGSIYSLDPIWSPTTYSSAYEIYFVEGLFSVLAMILDADGFSTVFSCAVVNVTASDNSSPYDTTPISNLLSTLLQSGQTSKFLSLMSVISTALNAGVPLAAACSSSSCRRILASSQAYRMAVRKLMLQKLSSAGGSIRTTTTAPSCIKTLKAIALNPGELDDVDVLSATNQLVLSSGALNPATLRAGSLVDIAKLGLYLLQAAQPNLNLAALYSTNANILQSVLKSSTSYSSTMLKGESPFITNLGDISVQVLGFNLSVIEFNQLSFASTTISNYTAHASKTGLSVSVVRLVPDFSPPFDGSAQAIKSETVGIQVVPSNSLGLNSAWSCSGTVVKCIKFSVGVKSSDKLALTDLNCMRWEGASWDSSFCLVENVSYVNSSLFSFNTVVACTCNVDGIFAVSVSAEPKKILYNAPLLSIGILRAHNSLALGLIAAISIFLLAVCAIHYRTYLENLALVLKPVFPEHGGKSEIIECVQAEYCDIIGGFNQDFVNTIFSRLEIVAQGYFPPVIYFEKLESEAKPPNTQDPNLASHLYPKDGNETDNETFNHLNSPFSTSSVEFLPSSISVRMLTFTQEISPFVSGDAIWCTTSPMAFQEEL